MLNVPDYPFNPAPSTIMHVDLNSCFASVEQQANPLIRGKAVAVAAYTTDRGCIIAPSIEAKQLGIKVGMRVKDGKTICPTLIILPPDPWKYRFINRKFLTLLKSYTPRLTVKSIDEMALDFDKTPILEKKNMLRIAREIKKRIKTEIGDHLTVSIGIAPSYFLAKTASTLYKPDGLTEINRENFRDIYQSLKVENLCGIKIKTMIRLNSAGIFTVSDMYSASSQKLKSVFNSILGYYWYLRLRGLEIDDTEFKRKSFGNSYALYKITDDFNTLSKIICHLVEKMGRRLRKNGFSAKGVCVSLLFTDYTYWRHGEIASGKSNQNQTGMYASQDLYKKAQKILASSPKKPVRIITVSCYNLEKNHLNQLTLLEKEEKKRALTCALDEISDKFGEFSVFPAQTIESKRQIIDRIAFGSIRELEAYCTDYFTSNVPSSLQ
ncbi:hypothetical protein A2Y99_01485 [Candidatus Gottesmanbacteria bacterium RBG_13_37_7]|uniref:UmuC domain-containing protein n=1 Tax=Candidatus Gottesmanbacteria bacterium RBG_13_37_7 TaxID=1798369 RepID=A0A1F5YIE3_9BACT|nr:MAG: hypothetical protein A2Y99_01485 [Candidatus Gottesmanbacteria bacterium RBG_13_37_7]